MEEFTPEHVIKVTVRTWAKLLAQAQDDLNRARMSCDENGIPDKDLDSHAKGSLSAVFSFTELLRRMSENFGSHPLYDLVDKGVHERVKEAADKRWKDRPDFY